MSELPPLGLYVHIPFCARKCPYCDFNTYAGLDDLHQALVEALAAEMARWAEALRGRTVTTVFVGGGTPTILTASLLRELFAAIHANFTVAPAAEITCEANPGVVDRAKFAVLRALGVNRLSMGVQSFQPAELKFLGRIHDSADVYTAYAAARQAGFDNINLDFIFGLPGQTPAAWQDTLARALALAPDHLSLYSLIVEPNTPLHSWVATGQVAAPDDDEAADLYEIAMATMAAAGYIQYEVSNWARRLPVEETGATPQRASQHNLLYWRNADYLGVGPGAHSHLHAQVDGMMTERRWGNRKSPQGYVKRLRAGATVADFEETVTPRQAIGETMMLGLRLIQEGVPFDRFAARHGQPLQQVFAGECASLEAKGLVALDAQRVRLTPAGLMIGNRVFAEFLPD